VRVQVTDTQRIDYLASRVSELLGPGAVCHTITQPGLQRGDVVQPAGNGDAHVITLLAEYATAVHTDPAFVEELKALWSAASADPDADLTAGALDTLAGVLDGKA
jgi:hypothetical protein